MSRNKKGSLKPVIISVLMTSFFVIPLRFERKTHALEGRCSIQLSYGTSLNAVQRYAFPMTMQTFGLKNPDWCSGVFHARGCAVGYT